MNEFLRDDFLSEASFQQVVVPLAKIHLQQAIAQHQLRCLNSAEATSFIDRQMKHLVLDLKARLLGERHVRNEVHVIDVPEDWWQAVRERWAPAWWLKRHPVRYRRLEFTEHSEVWHVCPHREVPPGHHLHAIFLSKQDPYVCDFCYQMASRPMRTMHLEDLDRCPTCGHIPLPEVQP